MAARKAAKKGRSTTTTRKGNVKSASARKQKLYTLTAIGELASVSMPTLQKYKRMYADRIPSVGEGRRQRYPRSAVAVLRQLKKENLAKRGRPRKAGSTRGKAAKRPVSRRRTPHGLLTLTEISRRTNISYPTVSRYVKLFLDRIPHEGIGRSRRFPPKAVAVFNQLRRESKPGRPPGRGSAVRGASARSHDAAMSARLRKLERAQAELTRQVASVAKLLRRPLQVTIKRR